MNKKILILCDREADYAQQLAAFLEKDREFPWEITVCSGTEETQACLEEQPVQLLLIGETLMERIKNLAERKGLPNRQIVILNESGRLQYADHQNIEKYQDAENVKRELLKLFVLLEEHAYPSLQMARETRLIGFYSPVRRCFQTTCALTCGRLLAGRHRVLHLSFEYFGSCPLLERAEEGGEKGGEKSAEENADLAALLYYLNSEKQKFWLHLKAAVKSLENWDYICPMENGTNLPCVTLEEWQRLLDICCSLGEYDYVVLDMTDSVQGLPDLLQQCSQVFTIVREDVSSAHKLARYEKMLRKRGDSALWERTVKLKLPGVPVRSYEFLEDYARGEIAEYLREQLKDLGLLEEEGAGDLDEM